jgi:hypothetical protein|tara:strand:+ start:157 stop:447 length:291 start_codon:yes stop_codon:yes gene_type:complete
MEENNKLIAEFMGYTYEDDRFFMEDSNGIRVYENLPHELSYNVSWDWLMPVIEKITELCEEPQELDELKHALLCVDIKSVYFIVVEFIKEYNNGKN